MTLTSVLAEIDAASREALSLVDLPRGPITEPTPLRDVQEALVFAQQHDADVSQLLSLGQQVWVADTLHMAAMLVGMEEHAAQEAATRAGHPSPRGATSPARGAPAAPPR